MTMPRTALRTRWGTAALLVGAAALSCRPVVIVDPPAPATPPATTTNAAADSTGRAAPPRATIPATPVVPPGKAATKVLPPAPAAKAVTTPASTLRPPALTREFRGVWVASVANIDWPSKRGLTTAQQQEELIQLLDRAVALKLNAVLFQVRPAADALYRSSIEPWSEYLTGAQGRAPDPMWDPLEFAVREAHARNLELHAWFNPYRARHTDAKSPLSRTHIANTNPTLVKKYGGYLWMDPGERVVRERTMQVVLDVVRRYDIDGVHIDDYFYPYPETTRRGRKIPFPDDASYARYRRGGGKLARADWRRQNVDQLVEALHDGIHKVKPWVRFGVSPFGIWRPGYPAQIRGFDAYQELYADARKWLREGWLDYFSPQLYWPTTKSAQSYPVLLQWWAEENAQGKHLWPGNFTSRAGGAGASAFSVGELVEQIRVTRMQPGAGGNVHFSMKSFLTNQASMNDTLVGGPYADVALVPATPWLPVPPPPVPSVLLAESRGALELKLGTYGKPAPWQWVVQWYTDGTWQSTVLPGAMSTVPVSPVNTPSQVTVRAINRVGVESPPISLSLTDAQSGSTEQALPKDSTRGRSNGR